MGPPPERRLLYFNRRCAFTDLDGERCGKTANLICSICRKLFCVMHDGIYHGCPIEKICHYGRYVFNEEGGPLRIRCSQRAVTECLADKCGNPLCAEHLQSSCGGRYGDNHMGTARCKLQGIPVLALRVDIAGDTIPRHHPNVAGYSIPGTRRYEDRGCLAPLRPTRDGFPTPWTAKNQNESDIKEFGILDRFAPGRIEVLQKAEALQALLQKETNSHAREALRRARERLNARGRRDRDRQRRDTPAPINYREPAGPGLSETQPRMRTSVDLNRRYRVTTSNRFDALEPRGEAIAQPSSGQQPSTSAVVPKYRNLSGIGNRRRLREREISKSATRPPSKISTGEDRGGFTKKRDFTRRAVEDTGYWDDEPMADQPAEREKSPDFVVREEWSAQVEAASASAGGTSQPDQRSVSIAEDPELAAFPKRRIYSRSRDKEKAPMSESEIMRDGRPKASKSRSSERHKGTVSSPEGPEYGGWGASRQSSSGRGGWSVKGARRPRSRQRRDTRSNKDKSPIIIRDEGPSTSSAVQQDVSTDTVRRSPRSKPDATVSAGSVVRPKAKRKGVAGKPKEKPLKELGQRAPVLQDILRVAREREKAEKRLKQQTDALVAALKVEREYAAWYEKFAKGEPEEIKHVEVLKYFFKLRPVSVEQKMWIDRFDVVYEECYKPWFKKLVVDYEPLLELAEQGVEQRMRLCEVFCAIEELGREFQGKIREGLSYVGGQKVMEAAVMGFSNKIRQQMRKDIMADVASMRFLPMDLFHILDARYFIDAGHSRKLKDPDEPEGRGSTMTRGERLATFMNELETSHLETMRCRLEFLNARSDVIVRNNLTQDADLAEIYLVMEQLIPVWQTHLEAMEKVFGDRIAVVAAEAESRMAKYKDHQMVFSNNGYPNTHNPWIRPERMQARPQSITEIERLVLGKYMETLADYQLPGPELPPIGAN